MDTRTTLNRIITGALVVGLTCAVLGAQQRGSSSASPPAPSSGSLQPGAGPNRFLLFVFANPMAGKDAEFDDWYTNIHIPDLLSLPGYYAAQRFRLVDPQSFTHSRLVIWHVEGDRDVASSAVRDALQTGKTRKSDAFDWTPGASLSATFEPISARFTQQTSGAAAAAKPPIGKKRYVFFEFANPVAGREAQFSDLSDQRIKDVMTVPGWMAGQRFRNVDTSGRSGLRRFLSIYDVEADRAKVAQDALTQAVNAGKVRQNNTVDTSTAQSFFLEPLTPYVRKQDVHP
jgi:hypothetical protein